MKTCTLFGFLLIASPLMGQAPVSNPRAIEFDVPVQDRAGFVGYRLEVFSSGSNIASDSPIRLKDFRESVVTSSGSVRIELGTALDGLPDGLYIATLRSLSSQAQSPRSAPTAPFPVTGLAARSAPEGWVLPIPLNSTEQVPARSSNTANRDSDSQPRWKFWNIVGAILAAAVVMPLLWRGARGRSSNRRRSSD